MRNWKHPNILSKVLAPISIFLCIRSQKPVKGIMFTLLGFCLSITIALDKKILNLENILKNKTSSPFDVTMLRIENSTKQAA
jgi:hypothetical protein